MSWAGNKSEFELEALEPRCLLSGALSAVVAAPVATHLLASEEVSVEHQQAVQGGEVDMFAGFETGCSSVDILPDNALSIAPVEHSIATTTEQTAPATRTVQAGAIQASQTMAVVAPEGAIPAVATSTISTATNPVPGAAWAEQLTETLTSANSPPVGQAIHLTPGVDLGVANGLILEKGDTLSGSGSLSVPVVNNSGLLSPGNSPGIISVPAFAQGPAGLILIEIGGTGGAGVNPNGWDQVQVAGAAQLDGTIQVSLFGGFIPTAGQSFQIFTWGSHTGEFANWRGTTGVPGHADLAFVPSYTAGGLTLTVVSTPIMIPGAQSAIDTGLNTLSQIGTLLNGIGGFAQNIPFVGSQISSFVDSGAAITNVLRNQLNGLLASLPREAEVTRAIESWNGTTVGGFTIAVNGVLGHYGAIGTSPFWWDINIDITPTAVNRTLQNIAGAVFGAAFTSAPSVQVTSKLTLDIGFGYDSGFFLKVDKLAASASINVGGLSGFGFNLAPPGGPLSLGVSNGSVVMSASVTATPDASVLTANATTGARISAATLGTIVSSATNVSNAFNVAKAGTLNAGFTLNAALSGFGFTFTGTSTVLVQSPDILNGADPEVTVSTVGTLKVLNQTLNGTFNFKKTATETLLEASGVSFELNMGSGAGVKRVLQVTNGSGKFLLIGNGLAGSLTLTLSQGPDIAGIGIAGTTFTLVMNTTSGAVPVIDGTAVNLPAGPYYRVTGNAVISLTNPQASLTGNFVFETRNTDGNPVNGNEETTVGVSGLSFSFSDALSTILSVTNGSGAFVMTPTGVYGAAEATVALGVSGLSLSGTFKVRVNNTAGVVGARTVDVNGTSVSIPALVAGPYLQVFATGATASTHAQLTVLGVTLAGDFLFEKRTTVASVQVVTVAATGMSFNLGSLATNILTVTNGSGAFLVTNAGLAGEATVTVGMHAAGVTLGGTFTVRINQTAAAVNETVTVGAAPITVALPAGPYLQIRGTGATLGFLGASVTGTFTFEQKTASSGSRLITVTASNVAFNFGTTAVTATNGSGWLVISDSGLVGSAQITVNVLAFGAGFSHVFGWDINSVNAAVDETVDIGGVQRHLALGSGPINRLSSAGPVTFSITAGGQTQSITAALVVTLVHPSSGSDYVTVGVSGFSTTLSAGGLVNLSVTGGTGAFVIRTATPSKFAGEVTVGGASLSGAAGVTLTATNLKVRVNNTGANVGPVTVAVSDNAADDVEIHFTGPYYRDYVAVSGAAELAIAGFVTLGGNFAFEVSETLPGKMKVGATDLHLDLKAGSLTVASFNHGTASFVLGSGGIAGTGTLDFQAGIIGMGGTITLEVNSTNAAVGTTINGPGGPVVLNLTGTQYLRVGVAGHLTVGSTPLNFNFYVMVNTGTGAVEFWQTSPNNLLLSISPTGSITFGPSLSALTNLDFARPGPFEFVSMLRQLGVWFDAFRSSSIFSVEIPFSNGTTLGDAFDWSQLFIDKIYSKMVSVELQSTSMTSGTVKTGALAGASLKLQMSSETPVALLVTDNIGSVNQRTGTELVTLLTNAINASTLAGRVVARINKDDQVTIALTEGEVAKGTNLSLVAADAAMDAVGFGPVNSDTATAEHVAVLTARYTTEDFFAQLGTVVGIPVAYNAAQQVYTYAVNYNHTYALDPVNFTFNQDFGPLGSASLNGKLNISANVDFGFTLGFDLGARDVPRLISSTQVPVPSNGRLSEDAHFQLLINGDLAPLTLTLAKSATTTNNSIEDLASDLNTLFATVTYGGLGSPVGLDQVLVAQKAGTGLAISAKPAQLGVVNRIIAASLRNDVFATEMGFGTDVSADGSSIGTAGNFFVTASTSTAKGLFIDNAHLGASLTVAPDTSYNANGISGSLRFGFVDVTVGSGTFGTLNHDGVATPLTASLQLRNQTTGVTRLYVSDLLNGTSSNNIGNMVEGPTITGSFLARFSGISVGGLGFALPLGPNPTVSVWVPDFKHLEYNANPYDAVTNKQGIFLTYPSLGSLQNFTDINFTTIIHALKSISDSLGSLSAFSFLDERLPLIDMSVNDMIDYAAKFADLIDAVSAGGSQTLQQTLAGMKTQIDQVFHLNPNILTIDMDQNGVPAASLVTSGGTVAARSSATVNYGGNNNGFVIRAGAVGTALNGSTVRVVGSADVTGTGAQAAWDAATKVLTIKINPGTTTANGVVAAVAALAGSPWTAALTGTDNAIANTGLGTIRTSALRFSMVFDTAYSNNLPFALNLKDLVAQLGGTNSAVASFLEAATTLIQIEGSGNLLVSASAHLDLSFGLDVSNPTSVKPFFYDTTGVVLTAKVLGTNISLQASLGSVVGIWIKNGTVTLDSDGNPATGATQGDKGAEFRLGLKDNNGDGRHYFDEDWFNLNNIDLHLKGGVGAVLPIFAPLESMALGGTADANHDGYPDNDLVVDIPDLVRLFTEVTATAGVAQVRVPGGNNDLTFTRTAGASANYSVVFTENAGLGTSAAASFASNTLTVQVHSGSTTALAVQTAVATYSASHADKFTVSFSDPTLPNNGAGTVTVSKLTLVSPDFGSLFDGLELCDVIAKATGPLLDGLDKLLGEIQDGLNSVVGSTSLPLIGNGLAGAANFIQDFREGLLKSLRDEVAAAGGNGITAMENAIKKAFWTTLGPEGLDILVNPTTEEAFDPSLGYSQLDVKLDCDTGLAVKLEFKKEIKLLDTSANPIKFDIGIPGFGLKGDGNVNVSVGFVLKFGFGVNKEDGFYFDSSAPASAPELQIYFRVTIPSLHFSGQLLFLQLDIADNAASPSIFDGHFEVDLKDPNNDGKLTWAELGSSGLQLSDIISAELGADASVNLDLAASFGGSTAFPRVVAQFHLVWHFDVANGAGDPQISFDNVALDAGSFISDFLGPILEQIRKVTEPIQPIIDVVQARIPILSDLAGEDVTLLTLAETFGLLEPSTVEFIQDVAKVVSLINSLKGIGEGNILIPFGAFSLSDDGSGNMGRISPLGNLSNIDFAGALQSASGPGVSSTFQSSTAGFAGNVGALSNFSIPVFDHPSELFNLFVGKSVRLVEWRMPTFKFEFTYVQKIPIYPPLYAQFGGKIGAEINIGFGYDTYGIQKFIGDPNKDPVDLLDGFYILTNDANGNRMPALKLTGEVFAGASISLLMVEVGVNAGISATINFYWNDNADNDGKMRVSEIIANAKEDPRCIFEIEGEISLFLEAYLKIDLFFFSIDKTWRFLDVVMISFELTCPEPVLAEQAGGNLTLNIGTRAALRLTDDTTDGSETFVVRHISGDATNETVEVTWAQHVKQFTGVNRIIVLDAGQGNDTIDTRNILSTVQLNGGVGNDTIYLSDGALSTADGGAGNDTITASSSSAATGVVINGGDGNDILAGGSVAITINGDGGNDTITGTAQGDTLNGGGGQDRIQAFAGNDNIDGGAGNDSIDAGEGNDFVLGGAGNDTINAGAGDDVVDGGGNDDVIYGGSGADLLVGGNGNDKMFGDGGADLLIGDKVGTVGSLAISFANVAGLNAAVAAIPTGTIHIQSIFGPDDGSAGNDFLVGGGSGDMIFGGDGNDFCYGGNYTEQGTTSVVEEDGNDFIDGGNGNDVIFGDDSMGREGNRDTGIAIKSGIWFDSNLNGVWDNGERGFAGVTVDLYTASNPPGMGSAVATVKTDSEGLFSFVGLDPNNYIILFSLPATMQFTTRTTTTVDSSSTDSDADPAAGPFQGKTGIFNVTYDQTFKAVSAGYTGNAVVTVSDASVKEGNTGTTRMVFTVTLSTMQGYAVEVAYSTSSGTATAANGDYTAAPANSVLVFNPGETSKEILVEIIGDTTYEAHEQFTVVLASARRMDPAAPVALTLNKGTAYGTILNDDPIPSISIQDGNAGSGVVEGGAISFTVTLSNPSQYAVTVQWRTDASLTAAALPEENSATPSPLAGADFTSASGTLTFNPGVTSQVITVTTLPDTLSENTEQFWVDLFSPTYASIDDDLGFGIITDDDALVSASILPVTPVGGSFRTEVAADPHVSQTVSFKLQLSQASGREVRLTWSTATGTAVDAVFSGSTALPDYVGFPTNGTPDSDLEVVFAPGETVKVISVVVNKADLAATADKMFFVNILSANNATIAAAPATESNHVTVVIKEPLYTPGNDGPWSVYFGASSYEIQEPASGTGTVNVTVHRTPGSSQAVAVFYTVDGSATSGSDYTPVFRQLIRFADNETSRTIPITVLADNVFEGDETINLYLRNPAGGPVRGQPDTATVTIHDGNRPVATIYPPSSAAMQEGTGGLPTDRNFLVVLRDPLTGLTTTAGPGGVTVFYETVQLTATAGADYVGGPGSVTIPAGQVFAALPIKVYRDSTPELGETFAVRLVTATGAVLKPESSAAIATIIDDDKTPVLGSIFYDNNANGFKDLEDAGISGVQVNVTYYNGSTAVNLVRFTDSSGNYTADVLLGQVSISVQGSTVTSPYGMGGAGSTYATTTGNETQAVQFQGIVGIPAFADVGYKIDSTFTLGSTDTTDVGRGGTDDTIFGGPGDDTIDAGGGDDHVVGGHWMTATDGNVPINNDATFHSYDAAVVAVLDTPGTPLHPVYDAGPVYQVDTSGLNLAGKIRGEIWNDLNANGVQDAGELFAGQYVVVTLLDCDGNPVNSLATNNGTYSFENLFVSTTASDYVVQFELPRGYEFAPAAGGAAAVNNDVVVGGRTTIVTISSAAPVLTNLDAGIRSSGLAYLPGPGSFIFNDPSYSVSESVKGGILTITVNRGSSFDVRAVVVHSEQVTAVPGVNYEHVAKLLRFEVGETTKTVDIKIIDTNSLTLCSDPLTFNLVLRDITGKPLDTAVVYIGGESFGTKTDDDTILGGDDWDVILGDSGNIPAATVIDPTPAYNNLSAIAYYGGPGRDRISGGNGPDFINGQLGDDVLAGDSGQDVVIADMGDDVISVSMDDDSISGGFGYDTVISTRDVAILDLVSTGATTATLTHRTASGDPLGTFTLDGVEMAQLHGGPGDNVFNISGWNGSAFVVGAGGDDTLNVSLTSTANTDMKLRDATAFERNLFHALHGFYKDSAVSLASGATYHLGGLEKVSLAGGTSANVIDASGYSRPVTLSGLGGDDTLIGGSASDTFVFDADSALGTDTITGNGGRDTIDFTGTSANVVLDLSILSPAAQVVNGNLSLKLVDLIENVTGGSGNDTLTGNSLSNVMAGGLGSDSLAGGAGADYYSLDTDTALGSKTITENIADAGSDILDFSGTTTLAIDVNLSLLGVPQVVNANLSITIVGEGIEEVTGGTLSDTIRGNSNNNVLHGGPGNDLLDGKSGDDTLDGGGGNNTLIGGPGVDTVSEQGNTNFVLTNVSLTRGTGQVEVLDGIEIMNLTGGADANTFNITGWTGGGRIDGGDTPGAERNDILIAGANSDMVLTDASIDIAINFGPITLAGMDVATLTDGAGSHVIDAAGWTGQVTLHGGDGSDTLIGGSGLNTFYGGLGDDLIVGGPGNNIATGGSGLNTFRQTYNAYQFTVANGGLVTDRTSAPGDERYSIFSGIQSVQLVGGASANRFDVTSWTAGTVSIDGQGGGDSVILKATVATSITLTNAAVTFSGGAGTISLASIEIASITGSAGDDTVDASGFSGTVIVLAGDGNDTLVSGPGTNLLDGGAGNDRFVFPMTATLHSVLVYGRDGEDTLDFSAFNVSISINLATVGTFQTVAAGRLQIALMELDVEDVVGGQAGGVITGNSLDNTITVTGGANTVDGGTGNNTLVASADASMTLSDVQLGIGAVNSIITHFQNARLTGGAGNNVLNAGAFTGKSTLDGGTGNDTLIGGTGADTLIGGAGNDLLRGGAGNDYYTFDVDVAQGQDTVDELAGGGGDVLDFSSSTTAGITVDLATTAAQTVAPNLTLTLTSDSTVEHVIGTDRDDVVRGNALDNAFLAGRGNDLFDGRGGTNMIYAQRDGDFVLTNTTLTITDSAGTQVISLANVQQAYLEGGDSANTINASAFTLGSVFLIGKGGNDILVGGYQDDRLSGGDGNDTLYGGGGSDYLYGDAGNDTLNGCGTINTSIGTDGNDHLYGGDGNDTYVFDLSSYYKPVGLFFILVPAIYQGTDTIHEFPGGGHADVIQGVGPGGVAVNLWSGAPQHFYDLGSNLVLVLVIGNPGEVEFSF